MAKRDENFKDLVFFLLVLVVIALAACVQGTPFEPCDEYQVPMYDREGRWGMDVEVSVCETNEITHTVRS